MIYRKHIRWSTTAVATALTGGALMLAGLNADAQPEDRGPRPEPREFMERADTDGDGNISFEELQALRPGLTREHFDRMDTNKDGVLNRDDRPLVRPGDRGRGMGVPRPDGEAGDGPPAPLGRGAFLERADTNGDGNISFEELQAIRPELTREQFDRMDSNKDGVLNREDRPEFSRGDRGPRRGDGFEGGPHGDRDPANRPDRGEWGGPGRGHGPEGAPRGPRGERDPEKRGQGPEGAPKGPRSERDPEMRGPGRGQGPEGAPRGPRGERDPDMRGPRGDRGPGRQGERLGNPQEWFDIDEVRS